MAIFNVRLELVHVSEDRTRDFGPFPFIQITYETIRVGEEGETEVAWFVDGEWETGLIFKRPSSLGHAQNSGSGAHHTGGAC